MAGLLDTLFDSGQFDHFTSSDGTSFQDKLGQVRAKQKQAPTSIASTVIDKVNESGQFSSPPTTIGSAASSAFKSSNQSPIVTTLANRLGKTAPSDTGKIF